MSEKLRADARSISAYRAPAGAIGIFWLGQAGFVLRGRRTTLGIDVYLSAREDRRFAAPVSAEELTFVDGFLATHGHRDHLDLPQWPALAASAPAARFVVPAPIVDRAAEAVEPARITGALPDVEVRIGDARIVPIPARHGVHMADAYTFGLAPNEYRHLGYVVELDGVRVYHAGDTIRYDGMAERLAALAVDVALLPINGRSPEREAQELVGNLSAAEAADLAADAGIPAVIPMHYELFARNSGRPADLVDRIADAHPGIAVLVLPRYGGSTFFPAR
jgi:L-ascorbate metabolism protein UlaG (beta-lactamase superfamily)